MWDVILIQALSSTKPPLTLEDVIMYPWPDLDADNNGTVYPCPKLS